MLQTVVTSSDCRRPKGRNFRNFSVYVRIQSINQSINRQARLDRGGAQGGGNAVVHRGSVGGGEIHRVVVQERRRG